jgi:hypothetical protein
VTSPAGDIAAIRKSIAGTSHARSTHRHSVAGASATPTNNSVTTTINASNHEPVFKKLNIINNGTGGADLPDQLILLWGGANSSIPTDWARFTSMDGQFIKGANANGESNSTTGGATTHTHTASNCQPTQNPHSHNWSDAGGTTFTNSGTAFIDINAATHTHTWIEDTPQTTATNNAATVSVTANSAESAYPSYARIIFIQYTAAAVGGTPMLTLLGVGT